MERTSSHSSVFTFLSHNSQWHCDLRNQAGGNWSQTVNNFVPLMDLFSWIHFYRPGPDERSSPALGNRILGILKNEGNKQKKKQLLNGSDVIKLLCENVAAATFPPFFVSNGIIVERRLAAVNVQAPVWHPVSSHFASYPWFCWHLMTLRQKVMRSGNSCKTERRGSCTLPTSSEADRGREEQAHDESRTMRLFFLLLNDEHDGGRQRLMPRKKGKKKKEGGAQPHEADESQWMHHSGRRPRSVREYLQKNGRIIKSFNARAKYWNSLKRLEKLILIK